MNLLHKAGFAIAALALTTLAATTPAFAGTHTGTLNLTGLTQGGDYTSVGDSLFTLNFNSPVYASHDLLDYLISFNFNDVNHTAVAADVTRLLTPTAASGYTLNSFSFNVQTFSQGLSNLAVNDGNVTSIYPNTFGGTFISSGPLNVSFLNDQNSPDLTAEGLVFDTITYSVSDTAVVPEPASMAALVCFGLGGAGLLLRRRRK